MLQQQRRCPAPPFHPLGAGRHPRRGGRQRPQRSRLPTPWANAHGRLPDPVRGPRPPPLPVPRSPSRIRAEAPPPAAADNPTLRDSPPHRSVLQPWGALGPHRSLDPGEIIRPRNKRPQGPEKARRAAGAPHHHQGNSLPSRRDGRGQAVPLGEGRKPPAPPCEKALKPFSRVFQE